jgi:hypothetical protein
VGDFISAESASALSNFGNEHFQVLMMLGKWSRADDATHRMVKKTKIRDMHRTKIITLMQKQKTI